MPDIEGYPTKSELKTIEEWKYGQSVQDLIEHIKSIWWKPDWGFRLKNGRDRDGERVKRLFLSTGGWSGNEDIVECLAGTDFWALYWECSYRGGHYIFEIPQQDYQQKKSV